MSEKDRRYRKTREALFDSFEKLLGEKSFYEITVKDITENAYITRSAFYLHYEDKFALLEDFFMTRMRQYSDFLKTFINTRQTDKESLADITLQHGNHLEARKFLKLILKGPSAEFMHLKLYSYIRSIFSENADEEPVDNANISLLNEMRTGILFSMLTWWINTDEKMSSEIYLDTMKMFISRYRNI